MRRPSPPPGGRTSGWRPPRRRSLRRPGPRRRRARARVVEPAEDAVGQRHDRVEVGARHGAEGQDRGRRARRRWPPSSRTAGGPSSPGESRWAKIPDPTTMADKHGRCQRPRRRGTAAAGHAPQPASAARSPGSSVDEPIFRPRRSVRKRTSNGLGPVLSLSSGGRTVAIHDQYSMTTQRSVLSPPGRNGLLPPPLTAVSWPSAAGTAFPTPNGPRCPSCSTTAPPRRWPPPSSGDRRRRGSGGNPPLRQRERAGRCSRPPGVPRRGLRNRDGLPAGRAALELPIASGPRLGPLPSASRSGSRGPGSS